MSNENENTETKKIMFKDVVTAGVSHYWSRKRDTRKSLVFHDRSVHEAVNDRIGRKVYRSGKNVTPKNLANIQITDFLEAEESSRKSLWGTARQKIYDTFSSSTVLKESSTGGNLFQNSPKLTALEDITAERPVLDVSDSTHDREHSFESEEIKEQNLKMPTFIKIRLKETDDILLYEAPSNTVLKGTDEAKIVADDNAQYDYLTTGAGKNRRTCEAEAQTSDILYKSRSANTERIKKLNVATFVSNYDMYDTYEDLERSTKSCDVLNSKIIITTYSREGGVDDDFIENLGENENFKLAAMVIERLLASNVYREQQKRFRNMYIPNPMDLNVQYLYRLETLWTYKMIETMGKAVSCLSWCETNHDLIGIGYGVYNFVKNSDRRNGVVCIWSIKNPVNPERKYRYPVPVTSLAFSKKNPQLLAVGLYNGSVEIRDITQDLGTPVGRSERSTSPGFEPVWQIVWIQGEYLGGVSEQILTISQDGRVMKYNLTSGPYLVGYRQLMLDRVEGVVEGLPIPKKKTFLEANRHPQALCLTIHPMKPDVYFVGTDEGCIHRCSTNYPHQHTGILQVHNGSVNFMEYSPWSPKIFLTCGIDWCIRIWIEDVFEPIVELSSGIGPVQHACWSPINSTIIASVTKTHVEIWDLRRKTLKPSSTHKFDSGASLTVIKFTNCGRSIVVGTEDGKAHVCSLEDMPFPPHYQYNELQQSLYKSLVAVPELLKQVKGLGYLGY